MLMLPHIASRIFGVPLLIHRAKLDVILAAIGHRLGVDAPECDSDLPIAPKALTLPYDSVAPGIAVIPIYGTLVKRTIGLEAASGLMSYQEIGAMLDAALDDPSVTGILLDIDSPGGEASGSFELARRVREAAAQKPVWAIANDTAFSAAYAIGCAAERLYVTETGGVGSIGVIALHVDQSGKDAQEGLKYTAVFAGARKNDYSPHEPLSDEARAALQAEVDRLYGIFVDHVAAMRGMDSAKVRDTEAALYFGSNAVSIGLADGVGTFDSVLAEFSSYLTQGRKSPRALVVNAKANLLMGVNMQDHENEMIGVDEAAALVAEARREVAQSAQAIAELCLIAGCPDMAVAFIAEGKSEAEVRKALLEMKATQSNAVHIQSTIMPEAGTDIRERPEASPVVAAVRKLVSKE